MLCSYGYCLKITLSVHTLHCNTCTYCVPTNEQTYICTAIEEMYVSIICSYRLVRVLANIFQNYNRNSPFCLVISMSLKATRAAASAPSSTDSGRPTNV